MNTQHGKPKPITVKALLDSGAAASLVTKKFVTKLCKKKKASQSWSAPGGTLNTTEVVKAQFTTPKLQDDKLIEWNLHVTDDLWANDMIICHDILKFLKIDVLFSNQTMHWGECAMPFKDSDSMEFETYHIQDDDCWRFNGLNPAWMKDGPNDSKDPKITSQQAGSLLQNNLLYQQCMEDTGHI